MAFLQPSLVPGLEDAVLLSGLKEMQILQTTTAWTVVHGPGMEFPLGPNLPKFQFTSNGLDKRAGTDYLSMFDYMARVYVPKPSDVHPNPPARVGASRYRSMFDYMLAEHRARVKRRSRRVYERPSLVYKRGLPAEKDNSKNRGIQSSHRKTQWAESHDGKNKGVEISANELVVQQKDVIGDMILRTTEGVGYSVEDSGFKIRGVILREEVLSNNSEGLGKGMDVNGAEEAGEELAETESQISSINSLEIEQLEEDIGIIATERRLLDEIRDDSRDDEGTSS